MGEFRDVGTSTMERPAPLAPAIVERIQQVAAERLLQQRIAAAARIVQEQLQSGGIALTDDEARDIVMADPSLLALLNKQDALDTPEKPTDAVTSDQPAPVKAKAPERKTGTVVSPAPQKTKRTKRPRGRIVKADPRKELTPEFMERVERIASEFGIEPGFLIRMNPRTGHLKDPERIAKAKKNWIRRKRGMGLKPKVTIPVPLEEQIKRNKRGTVATQTKIKKLRRELGISRKQASRRLTTEATARQRADEKKVQMLMRAERLSRKQALRRLNKENQQTAA